MKQCSVPGCTRAHRGKGFCLAHLRRFNVYGSPTGGPTEQGAPAAFLAALPSDGEGCVTWPFARNGTGNAALRQDGRAVLATRLVCERFHGPAPTPVHQAAHSCGLGHEGCVAPWHLSWETPAENTADALRHGAIPTGERSPTAKLTDAQAREIRRRRGESQSKLAAEFGVSPSTISVIQTGRSRRYDEVEAAEKAGAAP